MKWGTLFSFLILTQIALGHALVEESPRENALDIRTCKMVLGNGETALREGNLSPFWAQQLIGADLAQERMRQVKGVPVHSVPVGVIDGGVYPDGLQGKVSAELKARLTKEPLAESGHGTAVANLVSAPGPVGVGTHTEVVAFSDNTRFSFYTKGTRRMFEGGARLVNISQGMRDSALLRNNIRRLSEKAITVVAAGNSFPFPMEKSIEKTPGIVVGSLGPQGLIDSSSQENEVVTVHAPADRWLQSTTDGKHLSRLGSTSGATALVSGSLSYALAFVPDLSTEEAKLLLAQSAIPSLNTRLGDKKNGAGTVNALLIQEVAEKLSRNGFAKLSKEARLETLRSKSTYYRFTPDEAKNELAQAKTLLAANDCPSKEEGLKKLRSIFLKTAADRREGMQTTYQTTVRLIADVYDRLGFSGDADFYRSLVAGEESAHVKRMLESKGSGDMENAVRASGLQDPKNVEATLMKAVQRPQTKYAAIAVAANSPEVSLNFYKSAFKMGDDGVGRSAGYHVSGREGGLDLVKEILSGTEAFQRHFTKTPDKLGNVQYGLIAGLHRAGPGGLELLKSIVETPFASDRGKVVASYGEFAAQEFIHFGAAGRREALRYLPDARYARGISRSLIALDTPDVVLLEAALGYRYVAHPLVGQDGQATEQEVHDNALLAIVQLVSDGHDLRRLNRTVRPNFEAALQRIRDRRYGPDFVELGETFLNGWREQNP